MALIPQHYIDSVVAIGVQNNGTKNWIGTGFLYGDLTELTSDGKNKYHVYLVTNKHVLQGLNEIILRFNPQTDQSAKDYRLPIEDKNGAPIWIGHPKENVDVAIIKLNLKVIISEGMKFKFFQSDKNISTIPEMQAANFSEGDFVYVLGFPMGLISSDRQYVFARSGIISRIRDLYEKRSSDFVVDAFVFPGNSGGPVISKIEYFDLKGPKEISRSKLVGIIKAYIPYKDTAYSMQTKRPRITFEENTGLSLVEPVDRIIETIKSYHKHVSMRKK